VVIGDLLVVSQQLAVARAFAHWYWRSTNKFRRKCAGTSRMLRRYKS